MAFGPKPRSAEQRFWDKVAKGAPDECWEWTGARHPTGYGFLHGGVGRPRFVKAHRLSYEIAHGSIRGDLDVLHACDNPPCVNPAHLRQGTRGDNNRDRGNKGRGREQRGTANSNAVLDDREVRKVFEMREAGMTQQAIADTIGVKQPQVSRILRGESWTHLPREE